MRVDFYVTKETAAQARLRLACRLTEKAYLAGQRVFVWDTDDTELKQLDDLLWTFGDLSFIPHALLDDSAGADTPVMLGGKTAPDSPIDVLVNLGSEVPACASRAARIIEIVDGQPAARVAGRTRFKAYRDMGCEPATHEISSA